MTRLQCGRRYDTESVYAGCGSGGGAGRDELAGDRRARPSASPSDSNEWTGCAGSCSSVSLDHRRDLEEPQAPGEERVDGDLVGGVQHARRGAAGDRRLAREPQAGERVVVDRLERQRADLDQVERPDRDVDAVGVVQRVGDRHAHVGIAEVRERGAVAQLDQAWTIDCGCTTTSICS